MKKITKEEFIEKAKKLVEAYQIGDHCEFCRKFDEGEENFEYFEDGKIIFRKGKCSSCGEEIDEEIQIYGE